MKFLAKLLTNSLAVVVGVYLLKGIHASGSFWTIILIAFVIGLLNSLVWPVLIFLTIPITIVTFGLFLLVINAAIILLADKLLDAFTVDGFWWALGFSLIMWLINSIVGKLDNNEEKNSTY